jgi:hypothetical protein
LANEINRRTGVEIIDPKHGVFGKYFTERYGPEYGPIDMAFRENLGPKYGVSKESIVFDREGGPYVKPGGSGKLINRLPYPLSPEFHRYPFPGRIITPIPTPKE